MHEARDVREAHVSGEQLLVIEHAHTERPAQPQAFETTIPIPNITCPTCVLQVIEFMAEHPGVAIDGGHSYHHCATLNITADPAKPLDARW